MKHPLVSSPLELTLPLLSLLFYFLDNASVGSILSYVFYWIVAIVALAYMKWSEGRTTIFGYKSAAGHRRDARRQQLEKVDSYEKSDKAETPIDEDRQFASHV